VRTEIPQVVTLCGQLCKASDRLEADIKPEMLDASRTTREFTVRKLR